MKNRLTLLLLLISIFTQPLSVFAADNSASEQLPAADNIYNAENADDSKPQISEKVKYALLALGINTDGYDFDKAVTRGEFAQLIFKASMGARSAYTSKNVNFYDVQTDSDLNNAVGYLYECGIVSGTGNRLFSPDSNIEYAAAMKIAMGLLKYPQDYTLYDSIVSGNLSQNVRRENDNSMKYEAVFELIYNMMNTNTAKPLTDSGLYMNEELDLYFGKGIVEDDGVVSLTGKSSLRENSIVIDGTEYICDVTKDNLIGKTVNYYYVDSDEPEIKSLYCPSGYNKTLRIDSDDIEDFDGSVYTYCNNEKKSRNKTEKYPLGATLIYNGMVVTMNDSFDKSLLKPNNGYVEFLDNDRDGSYEFVYINDYVNSIITAYDNESISLKGQINLDIDDVYLTVYNENGEKIGLPDIGYESVISYALSADGKVLTIYTSPKFITEYISTVNEADNIIKTMSGEEYDMSASKVAESDELYAGKEYMIYFDFMGKAAYFKRMETQQEFNVVYLLNDRIYSEDDEKYFIKAYTPTGNVNKYTLAEKVRVFTDKDITAKRVKDEAVFNLIDGYEGIVRIKINDEQKITDIEIPLDKSISCSDETRFKLLARTYSSANTTDPNYSEKNRYLYSRYPYKGSTFGGLCTLDVKTLVIFDYYKSESVDDRFQIGSNTLLSFDSTYTFDAYGFSQDTRYATVLHVRNDGVLGSEFNHYPIAVKDFGFVYDEEREEAIYKISGMRQSKDVVFYAKQDVVDSMTDMFGKKTDSGIKSGDILKISFKDNDVYAIKKIYDSAAQPENYPKKGFLAGVTSVFYDGTTNKGNPYKVNGTSPVGDGYSSGNDRVFMGYVYAFENGRIAVTNQNIIRNGYKVDGDIGDGFVTDYYNFSEGGNNMVMYDNYKNRKISAAKYADVKSYKEYGSNCSRCLILTNSGNITGMILIND